MVLQVAWDALLDQLEGVPCKGYHTNHVINCQK